MFMLEGSTAVEEKVYDCNLHLGTSSHLLAMLGLCHRALLSIKNSAGDQVIFSIRSYLSYVENKRNNFTQTFRFYLTSSDRNQYINAAVLYCNLYLTGIKSSNLHSMKS